jgi:hypothetical protein
MLSARSEVGIVVRSLFEDGRGGVIDYRYSRDLDFLNWQATSNDGNDGNLGKVTSQKCPGKCHHSATHHHPDPSHPETAQNDLQRRR